MKANVKKLLITLTAIMIGSFVIAGIIFMAIGGLSSVVINAGQVKTLKVFPGEGITQINVNTVNTNINIIPVTDKNIQVDFYGNLRTNIVRNAPELVANQVDGVLNISVSYPNVVARGFLNAASLTLDIYVPREFSSGINAETISGNLKIEKFSLESFEFKSSSGNLEADSLASSKIKIEMTSGEVALTNVKGSIDINNISGSVDVVLESLVGDVKVKTISGAVTVSLPDKSEFNFELGSISGRIENGFGAQITFADGRKIEGTVGQGANMLTVNSTSGAIKIKKGE